MDNKSTGKVLIESISTIVKLLIILTMVSIVMGLLFVLGSITLFALVPYIMYERIKDNKEARFDISKWKDSIIQIKIDKKEN